MPTLSNIFTAGMFADLAIASRTIISPLYPEYEFFGFQLSLPMVISSSRIFSTSVTFPRSIAGEYTANGFIDDPG